MQEMNDNLLMGQNTDKKQFYVDGNSVLILSSCKSKCVVFEVCTINELTDLERCHLFPKNEEMLYFKELCI